MSDIFANTSTATGLCQALLRLRSENPVGTEEEIAGFIAEWFRRLGVEATVDEVAPHRPNVVARLRGAGGPALAYLAHMDTVPAGSGWTEDPFGGEVKNGRMYGRGAADMKSGLAAVMIAMKQVVESGIRPTRDFLVCATIDEEGAKMLGAVRLVERGLVDKDSLVVATEPTSLRLITAHKGVMWYRIETRGKMSHAGTPYVGADANHGLAAAIMEVKERFAILPHDHPQLGRAYLTVGQMAGGAKTNVVPDRAWAEVDTRLVPPMTTDDTERMLRDAVEAAVARVPGVTGTLDVVTIDRPPTEVRSDSPVLAAFETAFRDVTGKNVEKAGFPAYTDAAIVSAMTGNLHCALFGPGHMELAHTADEYVLVEELETASAVLSRAAMILLSQ